jgi:hypothetical protein
VLSPQQLTEAIGMTAYGPDGDEIGRVEHFFVDDRTGAPTWVAVTTGMSGTRHSIVPALDAQLRGGALQVPVGRDAVRGAPSPGDTQHLGPEEEAQLRAHYGLDRHAAAADPAGGPAADGPAGPPAGPGDGSMVRSEERLRVGTETTAVTRVRVVKYVVTEEVQVTVPLRREEIRIEEVPLDAPDAADETLEGAPVPGRHAAGGGLPEEIVLHREEPVVGVRVVPSERVRLRTEVVRGTEQVSGRVTRERVVVDQQPGTAGDPAGTGPAGDAPPRA